MTTFKDYITDRVIFVIIITQLKDNRESMLNYDKDIRKLYRNQTTNDNSLTNLSQIDDLDIIKL